MTIIKEAFYHKDNKSKDGWLKRFMDVFLSVDSIPSLLRPSILCVADVVLIVHCCSLFICSFILIYPSVYNLVFKII